MVREAPSDSPLPFGSGIKEEANAVTELTSVLTARILTSPLGGGSLRAGGACLLLDLVTVRFN